MSYASIVERILRAFSPTRASVPFRPLDVDWLGLDEERRWGLFLGDDTSPAPRRAASVPAVLGRVHAMHLEREERAGTYRAPKYTPGAPVFDVPARGDEPLHENPLGHYPHLVVARPARAAWVREIMNEHGGREHLAREALAISVKSLPRATYDALHHERACAGCRAIDLYSDNEAKGEIPPRSVVAAASFGFYVYGFVDVSGARGFQRIASPTVPLGPNEVAALGPSAADFVDLAVRFEQALWVRA